MEKKTDIKSNKDFTESFKSFRDFFNNFKHFIPFLRKSVNFECHYTSDVVKQMKDALLPKKLTKPSATSTIPVKLAAAVRSLKQKSANSKQTAPKANAAPNKPIAKKPGSKY